MTGYQKRQHMALMTMAGRLRGSDLYWNLAALVAASHDGRTDDRRLSFAMDDAKRLIAAAEQFLSVMTEPQ